MADLVTRDSAHLFVASRDGLLGIQLDDGEPQIVPWGLYGKYVRQVLTDAKGVAVAAAVRDDGIYLSRDGRSFEHKADGVDGDVRVLAAEGSTVYAGTSPGKLFKSVDGGTRFATVERLTSPWADDWEPLAPGGEPYVSGVVVRDKRVVVGVAAGSVLVSESAGDDFRRAGDGLPAAVLALTAPAASDEVMYAGTLDGLYRTTQLGTMTWKQLYRPLDRHAVTAVGVDPAADNLVCGASRALYLCKPAVPEGADAWLYHSGDGGATWQPAEVPLPVIRGVVTAIVHLPRSPQRVFASTSVGEIFESDDGGKSFFLSTSTLPGVLDLRLGPSGF